MRLQLSPELIAGQELRHLRTARGWSQEEVAERMRAFGYDWHQTLVGRIEAATRPLRLNEAADLAALFGISLDMLLTRSRREVDARELRDQIRRLHRELEQARRDAAAAAAELDERRAEERAAERVASTAQARVAEMTGRLGALERSLAAAEGRKPEQPT